MLARVTFAVVVSIAFCRFSIAQSLDTEDPGHCMPLVLNVAETLQELSSQFNRKASVAIRMSASGRPVLQSGSEILVVHGGGSQIINVFYAGTIQLGPQCRVPLSYRFPSEKSDSATLPLAVADSLVLLADTVQGGAIICSDNGALLQRDSAQNITLISGDARICQLPRKAMTSSTKTTTTRIIKDGTAHITRLFERYGFASDYDTLLLRVQSRRKLPLNKPVQFPQLDDSVGRCEINIAQGTYRMLKIEPGSTLRFDYRKGLDYFDLFYPTSIKLEPNIMVPITFRRMSTQQSTHFVNCRFDVDGDSVLISFPPDYFGEAILSGLHGASITREIGSKALTLISGDAYRVTIRPASRAVVERQRCTDSIASLQSKNNERNQKKIEFSKIDVKVLYHSYSSFSAGFQLASAVVAIDSALLRASTRLRMTCPQLADSITLAETMPSSFEIAADSSLLRILHDNFRAQKMNELGEIASYLNQYSGKPTGIDNNRVAVGNNVRRGLSITADIDSFCVAHNCSSNADQEMKSLSAQLKKIFNILVDRHRLF